MKNKVVIITGASSGIGLALAYEFAKLDAKIVITARRIDKLLEIEKNVSNNGGSILAVKTDVSIELEVKNLIDKTIAKYGKIDILINNAGVSMRAMFIDLELDTFKKILDINLWGTVLCTKYALPYILESKGSVVGVSSISGYAPLPARTAYCSAKYAMHGFLETLRIENLRNNLHVLIATPGFTESNIRKSALSSDGESQKDTPRDEGKMMSAEYVAKRIIKSINKRKRTLILSRLGFITVWFNRFLPKFTDKQVYKSMAKEPNAPFK